MSLGILWTYQETKFLLVLTLTCVETNHLYYQEGVAARI
jgi:hypothetical protein